MVTLGVSPPYRRLGIASELVRRSLAVLAECVPECTQVTLHVHVTNLAALAFYERHGFERVEKLVGYYARLTPPDAWVLTRKCKRDGEEDAGVADSDVEGEGALDAGKGGLVDEIEAAFAGRGYDDLDDEAEGEEEVSADDVASGDAAAWRERFQASFAPKTAESSARGAGSRGGDAPPHAGSTLESLAPGGGRETCAAPSGVADPASRVSTDSTAAAAVPTPLAASSSAPQIPSPASSSPSLSSPSARSSPVCSPSRLPSRVSSHPSSSPPPLASDRPPARPALAGVACLPALDGGVAGILDVETLVAELPVPPSGLKR